MIREDLSIKLAIPLEPSSIGLTGGYSCEPGLLMRLAIKKNHRYKVHLRYELICQRFLFCMN